MIKLRQIEWDEGAAPAVNARGHLPGLVADYFTAVRRLVARGAAPPRLHQVRLASKRIRHTLELFRPCYGPGLEERLDALRRLQELLGKVNDAVVARRLLAMAMNAKSAQGQRMRKLLDERAARKAREFRKEWVEAFDAPGQFQWWFGYLARHARPRGPLRPSGPHSPS
jgi:hypothetical protein